MSVQPNERSQRTNGERQVIALEMIADKLLLICENLDRMIGDRWSPIGAPTPTNPAQPHNEAAAVDVEDELGVTRHIAETFAVGAYRYTNRDDAMAQALRVRRSHEFAPPHSSEGKHN